MYVLIVQEDCTNGEFRLHNGDSPRSGTVQVCKSSVSGNLHTNKWSSSASRV